MRITDKRRMGNKVEADGQFLDLLDGDLDVFFGRFSLASAFYRISQPEMMRVLCVFHGSCFSGYGVDAFWGEQGTGHRS